MATIFDIAKKAGVSITTVSRALNGYSDVNENTRQMIVQIAEDLNYYPNAAARSLQGKKTNTIAFAPLLNDHQEAEPFFKEFTGVLALASFRHDLSLLVTLVGKNRNLEEIYRELAGTGRVDGIILADIKPQDERIPLLQSLKMPFVAFGRSLDYERLNYPFVDVDGKAGVAKVVAYLHETGHRRIAYLAEPFTLAYARDRYDGYRQGLETAGLTEDPHLLGQNLQNEESVATVLRPMMELPEDKRPTAIIAGNDYLALHVLEMLPKFGFSPGKGENQVAVTGFDDLPFASFLQPALTTLRQPITSTCTVLLDLLVALIKNQDEPASLLTPGPGTTLVGPKQVLLQPELIVRASA
ncbi:MAG: LacI family DNA-binding transcriptional regulator [Chloroflexi bacterium]|nr:LacI family DNA-binding transcriptional regulator [Chloroflexota bacterium]OJV89439.1 MAG: hypothetical protein BGO39_36305 [Chloroflexi bacterium 54-19]